MYTASLRKTLTVLLSVLFAVAMAIATLSFSVTFADSVPTTSKYFTYTEKNGHTVSNIAYVDDNIVIPLNKSEVVETVNDTVIDNFRMEFLIDLFDTQTGNPESIEFSLVIKADSYDVNGYLDNDVFVKSANNKITFSATSSDKITVNFNGSTTQVGVNQTNKNKITLDLSVIDNFIEGKVNGEDITANKILKYKVSAVDKLFSVLGFSNSGNEAFNFTLVSVDTNTADTNGNYKQIFKLNDGGNTFKTFARPRFTVNKAFWNDGKVILGKENTITFTSHAFLGNKVSTSVYASVEDGVNAVIGGSSNNIVRFNEEGNVTLYATSTTDVVTGENVTTNYEAFDLTVVKNSGEAPKYNGNVDAINSFKNALQQNLFSDAVAGIYVALGSDKYLTIPSMKNMVSDDESSYENLKYTIYYKTPTTDSSRSTDFTIPIADEGKYVFYVVFKDEYNNSMNTYDFMQIDVNNAQQVTYGQYQDYIFEFEIYDNAPMKIEAINQDNGFIGVEYVAGGFEVTGSNYESEYTLYFSETEIDEDASGWKEIVKASDATDENADYNGFTYDQIKKIAFNGELKFTPNQKGYYKLSCVVNSKASIRSASASTIIKVEKAPTVVSNDDFFADNLGSIVFLGIGVLCLIGIVILLCIKPKDAVKKD